MRKYNITVNGNVYEVEVEEITDGATTPIATPVAPVAPVATPVATPAPKAAKAAPKAAGNVSVTAPMPGAILDVKVRVGDSVKRGQTLFVLEAMKMENEIPAPQDGVVASVDVVKGGSVETGAVLATIN